MRKKDVVMRVITDAIGGTSFAFFLIWVYVISTEEAIILKYQDYFWVLIFSSILLVFVRWYVQVTFPHKKCNYLEDKIISTDGRFFCFISGTVHVISSIVLSVGMVVCYPSRELFYLVMILAILILCRGFKFIHATSEY